MNTMQKLSGRRQAEAAVLFELGKPLKILSVSMPPLSTGQVRVTLSYSGICHTQLSEVRGMRGPDRYLPHTLGHEGSGIVEEVGPGVKKVKPGDHVVLSWIRGTGEEVPSVQYESSVGLINSGALSTFMKQTVTCENRVVPIPKEIPLREAALLGCAVSTGGGIIRNTAKVKPGSTIAVFGVGGIGLSVLLAATQASPALLIAVDVISKKLELAKKLGAMLLIHAKETDPVKMILDATKGRGVDYAIEAAGKRESMEQAFQITRDDGGLCVLAGNLPKDQTISIDPFSLIKGKHIVGTWGGETLPDRDIPQYVDLFLKGKLNLNALISSEYSLNEINQALQDLEDGKMARGLIQF